MDLNAFRADDATGSGSRTDGMEHSGPSMAPKEEGPGIGGSRLTRKMRNRGGRDGGRGGFGDLDDNHPQHAEVPTSRAPPYTAFIGNLSFETSEQDLAAFFNGLDVKSVRIISKHDGKPRRFGFVEFTTLDQLKLALAVTGSYLAGRRVYVSIAESQQQRRSPRRSVETWLNTSSIFQPRTRRPSCSPSTTSGATLVNPASHPPRNRQMSWHVNVSMKGETAQAVRTDAPHAKLQVLAEVRKKAGGRLSSGSAEGGDLSLVWKEDESGEGLTGVLYDHGLSKRALEHAEIKRKLEMIENFVFNDLLPPITRRQKYEIATRGLQAGWKHIKTKCEAGHIQLPERVKSFGSYKAALDKMAKLPRGEKANLQRSLDLFHPILLRTLTYLLAMSGEVSPERHREVHEEPSERDWWRHVGLFIAHPEVARTAAQYHKVVEAEVEKALGSDAAVQEGDRGTAEEVGWLYKLLTKKEMKLE